MQPTNLLGIDIGTQGTKAVLFDRRGRTLAAAFRKSRLHRPAPGVVEEDPEYQFKSVCQCIKSCVSQAGVAAATVAAVGIDGQMAGILGIDADGRHVTPYDSWLDTRCSNYIVQMQQRAGEEIICRTGGPASFNHGPKILWWRQERPQTYEQIAAFVQPGGYAAMRLCAMDATAAFITASTPTQYKLTVTKPANGTITGTGINCGVSTSDCEETFTAATNVALTATAATGYQFSSWTGCSSTTSSCTVNVNGNPTTVSAAFAVIPPSGQFALTVTNGGNGKITSSPAGIDCGTTCSAPFNSGTQVTLTATPDSGYQFTGWSGACSGTATCTVTVDAAKSVTANFASTSPGQFALTVTNGGNGKVTSSPAGIDCGATCSASFDSGTAVALTATPDQGFQFAGWSGACSGTDACSVTMSEARSVTASFAAAGPGPYALTVGKRGSGSVTSSPAGIDCGGTCSASFDSDTLVTLTATPSTGWQFAGWSGACDGANTCTVSMDTARTITAAFIQPPLRDFDGDGRADLFWRQARTGRNNLWLMLGKSLKASSSVSAKGKAWSIAAVADFDGDKRADVLWRQNRTGQNQLWLMDAERVKSIVVLPDQATTYTAARTGDFDRDGKMDIIWASPSTSEVSLWLMDGASFRSAVPLPASLTGYALSEVDDFNGDNQPDVWWFNASTGENSLWLMAGTNLQSTATPPNQSADWMLAGSGLFGNDLNADVLWRNRTTGENEIWLMEGGNQIAVVPLPNLARRWAVAGVDDFNHDGQPDIFWRRPGNGQNRMWLMNGAEPSRRAQVTALSRGWATPSH